MEKYEKPTLVEETIVLEDIMDQSNPTLEDEDDV